MSLVSVSYSIWKKTLLLLLKKIDHQIKYKNSFSVNILYEVHLKIMWSNPVWRYMQWQSYYNSNPSKLTFFSKLCQKWVSLSVLNGPIWKKFVYFIYQYKFSPTQNKFLDFYSSFIHSTIFSFIHSFVFSFIHSFIHSIIRLFFDSLIHSFVRSFLSSFVRSFVRSFISYIHHSFIHSFNYSFILLFVRSFIRSFMDPFIHSFVILIHSFNPCIPLFVYLFIAAPSDFCSTSTTQSGPYALWSIIFIKASLDFPVQVRGFSFVSDRMFGPPLQAP